MKNTAKFLQDLTKKPRPVGSPQNDALVSLVETHLTGMGYSITSLPFDCLIWQQGPSTLTIAGQAFPVEPSPYSEPFTGSARIIQASTIDQLHGADCQGAILLLSGELTQAPLSPKDYPFYYPDEHRALITLLEAKNPSAIIAVTGATPLNGKRPFPLFEDGNFLIPSANIDAQTFLRIEPLLSGGNAASLTIDSRKKPGGSRQLVASKKADKPKGKIVLAAHMDTKYDTPGALDNGTGVAVLLETAAALNATGFDIDIVPFNSEEYFGANGELAYLAHLGDAPIALMINIDSPCHIGSQTAISFYNFSEEMQAAADKVTEKSPAITNGDIWYAGDHGLFLFRGVPCMAVASSDMMDGALAYTHTPGDTLETVDTALIGASARYLVDAIDALSKGF